MDRMMMRRLEMIPGKIKKELGKRALKIMSIPGQVVGVVFSPVAFVVSIVASGPRGYRVPEFISKLACTTVFAVATLGTYSIALELGSKVLCQRNCQTCCGWKAMQCTFCKGSGKVHYRVKNYSLRRGEKATAETIADAITENRAELVHLPSSLDLNLPLPSTQCPSCNGSGVMTCPECRDKFPLSISVDDIMEPPSKALSIMKKIEYPYDHIVHAMKDPSIAAFWLITLPQIVGNVEFDDELKQKIWWQYKDSKRYDQLRDEVAKRNPGWEYLQEALISTDPARAKDDPVIVKNIPLYKAKKSLEAEVMNLNPPPRPHNWGDLDLPLNASSWTKEDRKDPKKVDEMTILLNAQREIADKILDAQWETKWREEKLNEMLKEKIQSFIQNNDNSVLPSYMVLQEQKKNSGRRRWWFF